MERTTVYVSDDAGRIAMLEKGTIGTDDSPPTLTRYVYSNHLQSASLELDGIGDIISYEEYHPYGTTAFQAKNALINAVAKRYRYTGKERDEESGFYYHGARYYIPWLCRWVSVDPINNENYNLAKGYGLEKNKERSYLELTASSYEYSYDNPIAYSDPNGEQPPQKQVQKESEYIVKKNETLSEIALKHQTTVKNLVKWNQLRDENYIQPGQHLVVNSNIKLKSMYGRPEENFIDSPLTKYNNSKNGTYLYSTNATVQKLAFQFAQGSEENSPRLQNTIIIGGPLWKEILKLRSFNILLYKGIQALNDDKKLVAGEYYTSTYSIGKIEGKNGQRIIGQALLDHMEGKPLKDNKFFSAENWLGSYGFSMRVTSDSSVVVTVYDSKTKDSATDRKEGLKKIVPDLYGTYQRYIYIFDIKKIKKQDSQYER